MGGKQQRDQPGKAEQEGQAGGVGAAVRQARGGKGGVSVIPPQSVVLVHLEEKKKRINLRELEPGTVYLSLVAMVTVLNQQTSVKTSTALPNTRPDEDCRTRGLSWINSS